MEVSGAGVAFIVLVALVTGLLTANSVWRDPREGRRLPLTLACAVVMAGAGAAAAWATLLMLDLARTQPIALAYIALTLYALMALNVAWTHARRQGVGGGAMLLGVFWLPLLVLLRRRK